MIIFFITSSLLSNAQTFLELKSGIAHYGYKDLVLWQEGVKNTSDFNLTIVESFPLFTTFQGNVLFPFGQTHLGGGISYFSSGGRLGYWDDSGSLVEDQLIEKWGGHIITSYKLEENQRFRIDLRSALVVNLTSLTLISSLTLGEETTQESAEFSSANFTLMPSLDLKYKLGKSFGIDLSIGVEIEPFKQELTLKENRDVALGLPDRSRGVKHGWTGFRLLGGFYFDLTKKE